MKKFILCVMSCILLCGCTVESAPIDIEYNDGIYHIVVDKSKAKKKIKMYSAPDLMTNEEVHKRSGAELTVNSGFFDPSNGKTISYVVMDRHTAEDPVFNSNLFANPVLRHHMTKILNRTEFRIVECGGNKYEFQMVPHNTPVEFSCSIVEAVQGGPLILPELRLEEEYFIEKQGDTIVRESCSVLHKVPRTVLGLKDGNLHILIITDEHPMDMYEVQELCKKLGFEKAMGLDGGSSTSMDYKNKYHVVSIKGDGAGRKLKSFITVFK